jgi:hypothetical protein
MKKTLATATLAAIVAATAFAGYLQHVAVDVSDSRQNFPLRVARGEVVDLSIDYFDEGEPLDISGSEVILHTRTNGMDAAYSWQTPGTVSSNSALFTLDVDAKLPEVSGIWSVDFVRNGEKVTRPGGQAWVRGTAAGTVAADPVSALEGYMRQEPSISIPDADAARGITFKDPHGCEHNGAVEIGAGATAAVSQEAISAAPSNTVVRSVSVAVGPGADATDPSNPVKNQAIAIGNQAKASAVNAIAIGSGVRHADESDMQGGNAYASAPQAVAVGYAAKATADGAVQIGPGTNATPDSLKFGSTWIVRNGRIEGGTDTNEVARMIRDELENGVAFIDRGNTNGYEWVRVGDMDGDVSYVVAFAGESATVDFPIAPGSTNRAEVYKAETVDRMLADATAPHGVSPWAFPGDWRISLDPLAPETATNAVPAPWLDVYSLVANSSGWYYNVLVSALAEDRPLDDAGTLPDVEFRIAGDPSGAVASFTNNIITSSGAAGSVVVTGVDTNGAEKSAAFGFGPVGEEVVIEKWHAEDDGTERHVWQTNAWAKLAAVSTNAEDMVNMRHCRTKSTQFAKVAAAGASSWPVPRALNPWGTGGRIVDSEWPGITSAGVRNWCKVANGDFFWPELQTNLWCYSVGCHEVNENNDGCPALAVAPHYIVCAAHYPGEGMWQWGRHPDRAPRFRYGFGPDDVVFCSSRTLIAGNGSATKMGPVGSDIAVVRLPESITLPDHIICKFARKSVLDRLSLTQFERTTAWTISGHQVVTPCVLNGRHSSAVMWNGDKWDFSAGQKNWYAAPESDIPANVRNLEHFDHMYDSGSPHFLVSPKGQVVPWFQVYGASAGSATAAFSANGPAYTDAVLDEISNIIYADSAGREDIRYWTFEELWSGVGTNNLEEIAQ